MNKQAQGRMNRIALLVLLIGGLVFSYMGFQVTLELDNRILQLEQKRITDLVSDALTKELEISQSILSSIRGLFLASSHVSRDEFFLFTESELTAHSSIQALEWIPLIVDAQRETYRQRAFQDGLVDFDIRERNAQGEMIPARQRMEYFPVYYVEPLKGNESALGFNLASSEKRLASLKQAQVTGQVQATVSITLVQERQQQKGFLLVQPIFKHHVSNPDLQEAPLAGFALGVFRIGDLFQSAIQPIKALLQPLVIEVTDITDPQNIELLYSWKTAAQVELSTRSTRRITQDVHFANRTWRLSSIATPEFENQYAGVTHWLVLLTGFVLTLLITGYLRTLIRRESHVRRLVAQSTRELQASEKMGNIIVENAVDAVITIDNLGIINLFSPAAVKLFGYAREEVIGQNVKMLMPEPYRSEHDGYLMHHTQTGEKRIIGIGREVRGQRKDGSTFPMNLSVGKAQVNDKAVYVGTVTDLTELKDKEREMREFNNRLDLATRAGRVGVWDYDVVTGELTWDDRMFELYGVSREQFTGAYEAWHNALHPDDLKRAEAELSEAIKGGRHFDTEFRIIWSDGQERYIQASAEVLFDEKGLGQRMIGVNLDVTERKQAEEAMRQAKQAAEAANQQKSAFLNVMSHELRTPLTVILGYLPLLRNRKQILVPEAIAQIADDMDISGQHLMEMINDLLDLSKIEAGQMNLSPEEVQSLPLIQEMLRKFDNQAKQKDIQLVSDTEDFSFQVDVRRLRQILINLIGNALKFTHQGSIKISATRNREFVIFSVSDTGIGIPESELPFIFDTFRQVDDSSTRNVGGSGLGLAITKRLVEMHGGSLQVESKQGLGTTFTFTIAQ